MAGLAPVPGAKKQDAVRRVGIRISVRGLEWTLHLSDLGPADDLVARKETGLPVTPFIQEDRFGMDSLLVLYWTVRRKNGEPTLRFSEVLEEFPSYESIGDANFNVEALEEVQDDPNDPLP